MVGATSLGTFASRAFGRLVNSCPGRDRMVDNYLFLLPVPNVGALWTLIQLESWLRDGQDLCSD